MRAVLWSDYICPWCYVGQDRTALLRSLGVEITARPFELHPEIPIGGISSSRRYSRITAFCDEIGLPFNPPSFVPNSRLALLTAEHVRVREPDRFAELDGALFRAYFVEGRDIGDATVLRELSGVEVDPLQTSPLAESMSDAYDVGISGTPAWWIDDRLLIPGVQERSYYERMVEKLRSRSTSS